MAQHAKLSPSSSARWLTCPASAVMESGKPNTSSVYSAEGTLAHHLAEKALLTGQSVDTFKGITASVDQYGHVNERIIKDKEGQFVFDVDQDMVGFLEEYTTLVQSVQHATGGKLLIEQRLSLEAITNEKGAKGTADAIILADDEIVVIDLKYGLGVQVDATQNTQLMMYGLGALLTYDFIGDIQTVRLIISQPRKHHTSEWAIEAEALREWGLEVKKTAELIHSLGPDSDLQGLFNPSEKACKWCKASGECKPYAEYVHQTVMDEFISLQSPLKAREAKMDDELLAIMFERVDLIKAWVKTIEEATFDKLNQGKKVGEFKLVQGRAGARKWAKEAQAEDALKANDLAEDRIFKKKLISPTEAEKLVKAGELSKDQWQALQAFIVKPEGRPVIAPGHDKREAINPVDVFEDLTK